MYHASNPVPPTPKVSKFALTFFYLYKFQSKEAEKGWIPSATFFVILSSKQRK
jgi:hypothetical protein